MKERYSDAYVSYQSKYIDTGVTTKPNVSVNNHVPMDSVSAGHPIIRSSRRSVK